MAINTDLSTESLDTEQKEILDQESQLQILYSITSRLLVTLPRKISKNLRKFKKNLINIHVFQ